MTGADFRRTARRQPAWLTAARVALAVAIVVFLLGPELIAYGAAPSESAPDDVLETVSAATTPAKLAAVAAR